MTQDLAALVAAAQPEELPGLIGRLAEAQEPPVQALIPYNRLAISLPEVGT